MAYALLVRKVQRPEILSYDDDMVETTWTMQKLGEGPVNLGWSNFSLLKVLSMLEHGANGSGWKMVGNDGPNTFILHRNDP